MGLYSNRLTIAPTSKLNRNQYMGPYQAGLTIAQTPKLSHGKMHPVSRRWTRFSLILLNPERVPR